MEWNFVFFFNSVLLGVGLAMDAFSVSLANGLNETCMKKKKIDISALFLLSIPVLMAISGLVFQFNRLDFSYLILVIVLFGRYYFKTKKQN